MISLVLPTLARSVEDLQRLFNSLENQTDQNFELIVVTQENHDTVSKLLGSYSFKSKHLIINQKGLSLARNKALPYVNGDILCFTDDDCWYKEDSIEVVHKVFSNNDRQIVCFQHMDPIKNEYAKAYPKREQINISRKRILQQSSIDIFIHTKRVPDYLIGFDENFGLGAKYRSGEENIYLIDLKNKGYQIDYMPIVVSYHPNKEKLKRLDFDMVVEKGPLFKRIFGRTLGFIMYIIFYFKKFKMLERKSSLFKGISEQFKYKNPKKN